MPEPHVNITKACAKASSVPVETVLSTSAPVLHLDETGLRVGGKTLWVHSACTANDSHLIISESRGSKGIDLHLKDYQGTAIHDGWKSYFKYDCTHGLCNAHHLRELKILFEIQGHIWAKEFFDLLCSTYRRTKDDGIILVEEQEKIRNRAQEILVKAKAAHPPREPAPEKNVGELRGQKH